MSGISTAQIIIEWQSSIVSQFESMDQEHQQDVDLAIKLGWGDIPFDQLPEDWRTRRRYDPRIRIRF